MQDKLFRKAALEKLASPEQLDRLMQVTTPRGWLIMTGLGILVLAGVLWGIFGSIPTTVNGQGVLIRGSGIQTVESSVGGQITKILVNPGDLVKVGQAVAQVRTSDAVQDTTISSFYAGRVLELRVSEGNIVQVGTSLMSIEQADQDLHVVLFVSPVDASKIHEGLTVQVSPVTVKKEEYGTMIGSVASVGTFPVTVQGMQRVLGSPELIQAFSQGGALIQVDIVLTKAGTTSGYQWTSPNGPPITSIQSGTLCSAAITIGEEKPISLVFGGS